MSCLSGPSATSSWNREQKEVMAMVLSTIDRLLAQLHGVIGEARLVPIHDPRWGVYWAEAKRLTDRIDTSVPNPSAR
jgi:hypothetical protein